MINSKIVDGVAVLTMTYGKANALDIEFCDALATALTICARSTQRRSC